MSPSVPLAQKLRLGVYVLVIPWIAVALTRTTRGTLVWSGEVLLLGAAVLALLRFAPRALLSRSGRAIELGLWNLVAIVLLGELAIRVFLASGAAPRWLDTSPDVSRYRLDPNARWIGDRPNSLGFFDDAWQEENPPGVVRVAVLGDSYAVGMVPLRENYLTLADRALGDAVELQNFGIVHTALPEYLQTLEQEAWRFDPDVVLLSIYIGNDVQEDPPSGLFSKRGSKLLDALRTLARVLDGGTAYGSRMELEGLFEVAPTGARVELPLQSVEKHRRREFKHLEQLFREPPDAEARRAWTDTEAALERLVAACRARGVPLLATLAPDEIQVDDELFAEVTSHFGADPSGYDLDYPARRLRSRLDALGVPTLDLTPALREAERTAHTYHLRAVHWNAHGNAAAARALTPWLRARLAELGGPG